ncbi:MAG: hypothetical protein AABP62_16325 [Planctomycetota bacterium]
MKPLFRMIVRASVAAGLSLLACVTAGAQEDSVGIVRITKPKSSEVVAQQVTPTSFHHGARSANCDCQNNGPTGMGGTQCPSGWTGDSMGAECRHCRGHHGLWGNHFGCHHGYCHDGTGEAMCDYFRCKFGYFIPTGAGGAGVPWCGKYSRVYPQDPYYFDQRDGQTWAAQGYGSPIAVPLAPVVGHTYNYGWGVPSSRLTPVSRPAY